jgi:hypothetical protein
MYNFEILFELFIIKECNIQIQPKQLPAYNNEQTNLEINYYTLESKCKKIVTVTAVYSPSNICVVLEDHNTNVSRFINLFYLLLIIICFNNVSLQTVGVLSLFSG